MDLIKIYKKALKKSGDVEMFKEIYKSMDDIPFEKREAYKANCKSNIARCGLSGNYISIISLLVAVISFFVSVASTHSKIPLDSDFLMLSFTLIFGILMVFCVSMVVHKQIVRYSYILSVIESVEKNKRCK